MREFATVEALLEHLRVLGPAPTPDDPALTELDHAIQTATLLATRFPNDIELQVAGLLHDLAHPWDGPGLPKHALLGAQAVRGLLGDRIADLIAGHVPAKRWLVTRDAKYRSMLSDDSIMTLAAQGGDMNDDELAWFESLAHWEAMVELRRADDDAKVVGATVGTLDDWCLLVDTVARTR